METNWKLAERKIAKIDPETYLAIKMLKPDEIVLPTLSELGLVASKFGVNKWKKMSDEEKIKEWLKFKLKEVAGRLK